MSRSEMTTLGSVPLHTLEADVDYGFVPCFTTYGCIGVKVWIFRGLFGEQPTEEELAKMQQASRGRGRRRGGFRDGGRSQSRGPGKTAEAAGAPTGAPAIEIPAVEVPAPAPAAETSEETKE